MPSALYSSPPRKPPSGPSESQAHSCPGGIGLQYQTVGRELIRYEAFESSAGLASIYSYSGFREGVAFIGVEVLESYLDDLLDSTVIDEKLFIARQISKWNHLYLPLLGFLLAICSGVGSTQLGASVVLACCLGVILAIPFAMILYVAPRTGLRRRMAFAQVVSEEVLRRRGRSRGDGAYSDSRTSELERLIDRRVGRLPLQGATRISIH